MKLAAALLLACAVAASAAEDPKKGLTQFAFIESARQGDVRAMKNALRDGASLDAPGSSGRTALHAAAAEGRLEAAKFLLGQGADPWRRDDYGDIPFDLALRSSTETVRSFLFDAMTKKDPDALGTVLHAACIWGLPDLAARELAAGADVGRQDYRSLAPLHQAFSVLDESARRARLILERREKLKLGDWLPDAGRPALVKLLLDKGADPSASGRNGWTPLEQAVVNGAVSELKLLLMHSPGPNARLVERAAGWEKVEALRALLESGSFPPDTPKAWPLHHAAYAGSVPAVEALLAAGYARDRLDDHGRTPLDRARERVRLFDGSDKAWALFERVAPLLKPTQAGAVTDDALVALIEANFKMPPFDAAQRQAVRRFATLVFERHRPALADFLKQDRDRKARKRFAERIAADSSFRDEFSAVVLEGLNKALGDRGYAKPLEPVRAAAEPVPASAALLAIPALAEPIPYIAPLPFSPEYGQFRSVIPDGWGKDRVLGARWRHELGFESELRGLAAGPGGKVHFVESPRAAPSVLRALDASGRATAQTPTRLGSRSLTPGTLGPGGLLAFLEGMDLYIQSPAAAGEPQKLGPAEDLVFAAGTLVAVSGKERDTLTAYGPGGKSLWTRRPGRTSLALVGAGPLPGLSGDTLLTLGFKGRSQRVLLLDAKGKIVAEHPSEDWLRVVCFGLLDHGAARLVAVKSGAARDLLQVWEVSPAGLTLLAEADLGWASVETLAFADLDGDGDREIVAGTSNGWTLVFSARAELRAEHKFVTGVTHLAAGDLDGDGADEVLVGVGGIPPQVFSVSVTDNAPRKR